MTAFEGKTHSKRYQNVLLKALKNYFRIWCFAGNCKSCRRNGMDVSI